MGVFIILLHLDRFVHQYTGAKSVIHVHSCDSCFFFFKTIFKKRANRDVTSPVLHENKLYFYDITYWPESDYSLSVVFTCIANKSFNFSASE